MLELNWNPTDKLKNKNALFGPNLQPPTRQQERTFARVGTEKVFALRAQGGGGVGYLEPKLHRVVTDQSKPRARYTKLQQFGPNLQPPTQQQERTFARVGTEKVFALRARTPPLPLYSWSGCLSTGRETRLGWQMYQN